MKENLIKIIKWSIISIFIAIIIYDVIFETLGYTISEVMRDWVDLDGLWILPYCGSVIVGHWWINIWSKHNWWTNSWHRYFILIYIGVVALLLNITSRIVLEWYVTIPLGLVTGAILWPQLKKKRVKYT